MPCVQQGAGLAGGSSSVLLRKASRTGTSKTSERSRELSCSFCCQLNCLLLKGWSPEFFLPLEPAAWNFLYSGKKVSSWERPGKYFLFDQILLPNALSGMVFNSSMIQKEEAVLWGVITDNFHYLSGFSLVMLVAGSRKLCNSLFWDEKAWVLILNGGIIFCQLKPFAYFKCWKRLIQLFIWLIMN